jgi:hypothetical protein
MKTNKMNLCILWVFIKQVYHDARSTECEKVTHYISKENIQ